MYLLTLTAPGENAHARKRFAPQSTPRVSQPSRDFAQAPNDPCGCETQLGTIGEWNVHAARRWNLLRTRLKQQHPDLEFFRAVETQKRGALHLHVIVWTPDGPLDPAEVQRLALAAGFGCQVDLAPIEPGSRRHAYYVGKYVTKSTQERYAVPWTPLVVDEITGEMTTDQASATFRTWSMSRGYGITMKALREEGRRLARAHREASPAVAGATVPTPDDLVPATICAASP